MKVTVPEDHVVKYEHHRHYLTSMKVSPRGGMTVAYLYRKEDLEAGGIAIAVSSGVAHCHPNDNYNKRIGRAIALGRALKQNGQWVRHG